ncbi:MAG: N-acylneuraminate cytidylyltransferase [Parcubacteria group bacterium GW2011_GWA2_47_12]|nr:MAG: N-acylneuraminate cytidylyltransferase [Parcubacteria group bacterium GW2011_GWA2_47_12]
MKEPYNVARQMLPDIFQNNGCMNAFWPETILEKKSMTGEKIAGFVMDEWESVNIDHPVDFLVAEEMMKVHQEKFI